VAADVANGRVHVISNLGKKIHAEYSEVAQNVVRNVSNISTNMHKAHVGHANLSKNLVTFFVAKFFFLERDFTLILR
jgi:hypothetical protein